MLDLFFCSFLGTRALGEREAGRATGCGGESLSVLLLESFLLRELSEAESEVSAVSDDLRRPRRSL